MKREPCFWCGCEPGEAPSEMPHSTWCPHYRRPPLPPGAYVKNGRVHVDSLADVVQESK